MGTSCLSDNEFIKHIKATVFNIHFNKNIITDQHLSQENRIRIKQIVGIGQSEHFWIVIEGLGADDYHYSYLLLGIVPEEESMYFNIGEVEIFNNKWHHNLEIITTDIFDIFEIQDRYFKNPEGWILEKEKLMLTDELLKKIDFICI